jgi:hypothetical protein
VTTDWADPPSHGNGTLKPSQIQESVDWGGVRLQSETAVPRPSIALLVFWTVAFATVIFGHYQISYRFNLPYKALSVLVCVLAPLTPGFMTLLTKRAVLYLLLFELVLIAGCLTGYTGSPSDLIRVASQPVVMLRVLPFMLCGYTLAAYPRSERWFIGLLLALFAAITFPDALVLLQGTASGKLRERFLTETYDQNSARALTSAMVNLSVMGILLALAGCRLYDSRQRIVRWIVAVPQAVLLSLSITAGFTAAALLFIWCGFTSILFAPARTLRFRLALLLIIAIVLPGGLYVLRIVAGETGGSLAKIYGRVDGLRQVITGQDSANSNEVTSGRYMLAARSMSSFARNPFIGQGKGRQTSELGGDTETIGGHSFLLDSLGQRGILGTLPLIMCLWSLASISWQCLLRERSWRASTGLSFVLTLVVAITINPYFLGYLALNYVIFLWFGFILGDGARVAKALAHERERRLAMPPPMRAAG